MPNMSSEEEAPPCFSSLEEEIAYWKKCAKETREELEEFQEGSRELEAELEMQLEQAESRLKDQRSVANRLQMENDQMRDKLEQCQREFHCRVSELQSELGDITAMRDSLTKYVRDLEQQNDDLERAKRSTLASVEDFESRLNAAIERNAFLESELDEKESLKAAVQRMKDETRDLKAELRLLAPRHPNLSSLDSSSVDLPDNDRSNSFALRQKRASADSNKLAADCETKSERGGQLELETPPSSSKSSPVVANGTAIGQPLTPSARISALNIVGDLLRKVGALELKLVSCRNIVKENSTIVKENSSSANGSPTIDRSRRIPRGASTPVIKKIVDSA